MSPDLTIPILVGSMTALAVLLLAVVVIGIRREPQTEELSEQAPTLISAFVRRLLGVYVSKPEPLRSNAPDPDVLRR